MRLLPPITDRRGNIYVLYGAPDRVDTTVYVGQALAGWSGGCQAHRGFDGLHGWVGRADRQAWYWSGTALVEVDGETGACSEVLSTDPVSGTEVNFLGVAPRVDDTPSHRYTYALVQGATGTPQFIVVDLDERLPFNARAFPGDDPENIVVVGTGAWHAKRQAAFVVSFDDGGARTSAVLFLDRFGTVVNSAGVDLPTDIEPYAIPGDIVFNDQGVGVGVLADGQVLVVNQSSGGLVGVDGWEPAGAFEWAGVAYLVGTDGSTPAIARVSATGDIGAPTAFVAAERARERLGSPLTVNDERSDPSRRREWSLPRTAIGDIPLISPYPLDRYTLEPVTAVAFIPIGVAVP
jgi:hypothetical protein